VAENFNVEIVEMAFLIELDGNIARRFPSQRVSIHQVLEVAGKVWLMSDKGAYLMDGNAAKKYPDENVNIRQILEIDGAIWLRSDKGAYRIDGDSARKFPDEGTPIKQILPVGGTVWLASKKGAYRVDGDVIRRSPDKEMNIKQILEINGTVWLRSDKGAYRVDENVTTRVTQSFGTNWLGETFNKLMPDSILLNPIKINVSYYDSNLGAAGNYGNIISEDFQIIMENDANLVEEKLSNGGYEPFKNYSRNLPVGKQSLHYKVRDQWNNNFQGTLEVWVLPKPIYLLGILIILSLPAMLIIGPMRRRLLRKHLRRI